MNLVDEVGDDCTSVQNSCTGGRHGSSESTFRIGTSGVPLAGTHGYGGFNHRIDFMIPFAKYPGLMLMCLQPK